MYPREIIFGMTLYDILMGVGVIAAMLIFRYFSDREKFDAKYHNFVLGVAVVTVIGAYFGAVALQAVWNALAGGKFSIGKNTGATFFGGLLGGAAVFFAVYFLAGRFVFKDGLHKKNIYTLVNILAVSIPAAHSLGRVGCLTAGCCHGAATDAWYGIYMVNPGYRVIPVQLYEAVFLAVLAAVLFILCRRGFRYCMPVYMISYSVWRFFVEFLRGDDRGSSFIPALSPSQLISVLLFLGGAVLLFLLVRREKKLSETSAA
ncbi:MAG: prolipoprotein diacylglyceryl transferase [Clostridia bacterium]|nr:prolipoprotein diacylglyceryl transferase [Clostridia bacterium]